MEPASSTLPVGLPQTTPPKRPASTSDSTAADGEAKRTKPSCTTRHMDDLVILRTIAPPQDRWNAVQMTLFTFKGYSSCPGKGKARADSPYEYIEKTIMGAVVFSGCHPFDRLDVWSNLDEFVRDIGFEMEPGNDAKGMQGHLLYRRRGGPMEVPHVTFAESWTWASAISSLSIWLLQDMLCNGLDSWSTSVTIALGHWAECAGCNKTSALK